MAKHMLDRKRIFIQAESEIAAINMVYGAAATGARAMTSSSSPGISLKQEGISYACGADVPCVIVNVAALGPRPRRHLPLPGRLLPVDPRRRPRRW